jgi:apolipoprotein N-acyltransferase
VALVQASNVYAEKFSSAEDLESFVQEILNDGGLKPDLVVFPETVFTFDLKADPTAANAAIEALDRVSREQDVAFLLSMVELHSPATPTSKSTSKISSWLISDGDVRGRADKARTIPFAEYTPEWAVPLINIVGAQAQRRPPGSQYSPMEVKGIPLVPLTCFESLDQSLVERRLNGRPGLLVNQSNLDTFGEAGHTAYQAVMWQHMSYEQRWTNQWQVPVVRAVRSGGSTVTAADGTVDLPALNTSWAREFVKGRVAIREPMPLDCVASYVRMGLHGFILFLAGAFLLACVIKRYQRKGTPI